MTTGESLGEKETGARAALPMWMDFMRAAIAGKPNEAFATGDAPKKVLEVPLSTPDAAAKKKAEERIRKTWIRMRPRRCLLRFEASLRMLPLRLAGYCAGEAGGGAEVGDFEPTV